MYVTQICLSKKCDLKNNEISKIIKVYHSNWLLVCKQFIFYFLVIYSVNQDHLHQWHIFQQVKLLKRNLKNSYIFSDYSPRVSLMQQLFSRKGSTYVAISKILEQA